MTFSQVVAMVAGWEAGNDLDSVRVKEVTNNYGFGVGKGTLSLVKSVPKKDRGQIIESLKHQGTNDFTDLLERLQKQNKWMIVARKENNEDQRLKNKNLGHGIYLVLRIAKRRIPRNG